MSRKVIYGIFFFLLEIVVLLVSYFSKVFMWIFIGILALAVIVSSLYLLLARMKKKHPEKKMGKCWQPLMKFGEFLKIVPSECEVNTTYSNKEEMERRLHLQLPDFRVLSCQETKATFCGDYHGWMEIEFCEDLPPETVEKLRSKHSGNKIRLQLSNDMSELWNIELSLDSRKALIRYGRINDFFLQC